GQGLDVDLAGDRVGVHVRGQRLGYGDRADQARGDVVELDLAAVGFGRGRGLPVQGDVEQFGRNAAHGEVAALALVVDRGPARQAAHGLGHVLVGQAAGVVGADRVDLAVGVALVVDGEAVGRAAAGDHDAVEFDGAGLWGSAAGRVLRERDGGQYGALAEHQCLEECITTQGPHVRVPPEDDPLPVEVRSGGSR